MKKSKNRILFTLFFLLSVVQSSPVLDNIIQDFFTNEYIDSIESILDYEKNIIDLDERKISKYYINLSEKIQLELDSLSLKCIEIIEIYKIKIKDIEDELELDNYYISNYKPRFMYSYNPIPFSRKGLKNNIYKIQFQVMKSQFIKTYDHFKQNIDNLKKYWNLLIELKGSRRALTDPLTLKKKLEESLELQFYTDMPHLLKGIQLFQDESENPGMLEVKKINGRVKSITWKNELDSLIRVREYVYFENGLLATLTDKVGENTFHKTLFGKNDISSKFFKYIFSPGFLPVNYDHMTEVYYDESFNLIAYRFLTINGNMIGSIFKEYDDMGHLSVETWTQGESNKVVREFRSTFDSKNGYYQLFERDKSGQIVYQEIINSTQ